MSAAQCGANVWFKRLIGNRITEKGERSPRNGYVNGHILGHTMESWTLILQETTKCRAVRRVINLKNKKLHGCNTGKVYGA